MRGLPILMPAALLPGGIFLAFFIAAARQGQLDDPDVPPRRMLRD